MKKMIILLLFTLLIVENHADSFLDNYSIFQFIDYLMENGFYDLIYWSKCEYDNDIAIYTCLEFAPSIHCGPVVRYYMKDCNLHYRRGSSSSPAPSPRQKIYKPHNLIKIKKKYTLPEIERKINHIEEKIKIKYEIKKEEYIKEK